MGGQTKGWADRLQDLPLLRTQLLYSPRPGEPQHMTQLPSLRAGQAAAVTTQLAAQHYKGWLA